MGIVNGTTNYMLTRMVDDGLSYEDALAEAQAKGFAEADPTADVDGFDAGAKIAILASIAFNSPRDASTTCYTEGIRNITHARHGRRATTWATCIKLLALAHRTPEGIDVRVHPTMLPKAHQLATGQRRVQRHLRHGRRRGRDHVLRRGRRRGPCRQRRSWATCWRLRAICTLGIAPVVGCACTDNLPIVPMDEAQHQVLHPFLRCRPFRRAGRHGRRVRQARRQRAQRGAARQTPSTRR